MAVFSKRTIVFFSLRIKLHATEQMLFLTSGWKIVARECVPDDVAAIKNTLLKWSDQDRLQVLPPVS
jgi:hypothetical protein